MDYTEGSIRKAVILLAIPMMLEMCMESVFAVVDIYFVSHLGKHAVSTVGLTESVITIVYSLAIGISMAATAMVARRVGEKNPEAATKAGMQSILVSLAITICLSIPGFIYAADILRIMGAEPAAVFFQNRVSSAGSRQRLQEKRVHPSAVVPPWPGTYTNPASRSLPSLRDMEPLDTGGIRG